VTGGAAAAPTRRRLGREQRRAAIIEGAATAFARGGFAGTSMADISPALVSGHDRTRWSGRALTTHALALEYGFTDVDGRLPPDQPWQPPASLPSAPR
jgi:hypothetical protein